MDYPKELKNSIMKSFKTKSINDIAANTGISKQTLYKWKQEKEDSKEIRRLIREEKLDEAEEIALEYPKNPIIQSQLIKIYIEKGRLDEAEKIGLKSQDDIIKQSQLITIYKKQKKFEKAEEIALRYPDDLLIQNQLVTVYIERKRVKKEEKMKKYSESLPIQNQLKENQQSKQTNESEKVFDSEYFSELREKIVTNKLEVDDIQKFQEQKGILEGEQYNIIRIAMFNRLGNIKGAMKIVKSLKNDFPDSKIYNIIKNELEKKKGIFDIEKWDKWIRWNTEKSNSFINEIETMKEKSYREEISIPEEIENPIIKKNEKHTNKDETIRSKMSLTIKDIIEEINKRYYVKMRKYETKNKYVDRFNKLQSILETNSNNKRVQIELMLVLINEGYEEVVEKEFTDDYEIINKIIEKYRRKEISASVAKKQMDQYCL